MDWRAGHLTTTEGMGGEAFANKNCSQGRAFEQFFSNAQGMPGGLPGGGGGGGGGEGGCSRLELTHT